MRKTRHLNQFRRYVLAAWLGGIPVIVVLMLIRTFTMGTELSDGSYQLPGGQIVSLETAFLGSLLASSFLVVLWSCACGAVAALAGGK